MTQNIILCPTLAYLVQIWTLPFCCCCCCCCEFCNIVTNCCKLSLLAISIKNNEPTLRNWQKNSNFEPDFGSFGPNLGRHFLFFLYWLPFIKNLLLEKTTLTLKTLFYLQLSSYGVAIPLI